VDASFGATMHTAATTASDKAVLASAPSAPARTTLMSVLQNGSVLPLGKMDAPAFAPADPVPH
jgi:hypothetical protein